VFVDTHARNLFDAGLEQIGPPEVKQFPRTPNAAVRSLAA
jgi:hypothetical protein